MHQLQSTATKALVSELEGRKKIKLIDSHVHLEEIKDLEGALARAKDAGVVAIVGVASDYPSCKFALELSDKYNFVYSALGIHPWNVASLSKEEIDKTFSFIEANIAAEKVVAIGEVGLDFWYKEVRKSGEKRRIQMEIFSKFLELANAKGKPIIIHSRGAWGECFELVKKFGVKEAIFHWYSGPKDILAKILKSRYFISATPAAEYSKGHQEAIELAAVEQILLETDAPVAYKGIEAEPVDVFRSLSAVARIKNLDEEIIAAKTTENSCKIFGIVV